jgi:hypothetical protein
MAATCCPTWVSQFAGTTTPGFWPARPGANEWDEARLSPRGGGPLDVNAYVEHFVRTVRAECVDWLLDPRPPPPLEHVLRVYTTHYNRANLRARRRALHTVWRCPQLQRPVVGPCGNEAGTRRSLRVISGLACGQPRDLPKGSGSMQGPRERPLPLPGAGAAFGPLPQMVAEQAPAPTVKPAPCGSWRSAPSRLM